MSTCEGKIRRYGAEYMCPHVAVYAVRNRDTGAVLGACRQHLAQVIDDMDAENGVTVCSA